METNQDFIFNGRGQFVLISVRTCERDGSGVVELKTVFSWNGHHGHRTCSCVISFYGDIWRDWSMFLLFLLVLMNWSRELLLHWIILPETCYCMVSKSLTFDLTCAILNTYEIGPRINLLCSTRKLFNFTEVDEVVFKIIGFKMMSIFWTPCI